MKNSSKRGKNTLRCEILGDTPFGTWLIFDGEEFYLNHHDFPWFRKASLEAVLNVKVQSKEHLFWPDLDVDLHVDSMRNPKAYPLKAKTKVKKKITRRIAA